MAIVETIAAVGLYWYYAIHFDNYLPPIIKAFYAEIESVIPMNQGL